ncbi:MAG: hypothetical protein COA43_04630 [Robiginitomaculum sp.]|nr:MAG: hypothetical protein COA43_04630 [Robiginitomaculum sp.]
MAKLNYGQPSRQLTIEDAVQVWVMLRRGWLQSRIAAHFDVNSGRISEIKTGRRFPEASQIALHCKKAA